MPKISVLMPIYNTNLGHLQEAINSILQQSEPDFEFLILNDSPDNQELENFVLSFDDKRIKYLKNEKNMGISASRNKLIDLASGKYLATMDHDDISLPERLKKEADYLDANEQIGVVGSWYQRMGVNKIVKFPSDNLTISMYLTDDSYISHSSTMIRKSVLDENNIRYESEFTPAEDYALWCRLIGKTEFYNIPEVLFLYRRHENQTSKLQTEKMYAMRDKIRSFVRAEHPDLYAKFSNLPAVVSFKLLGFIPLGKYKMQSSHISPLLRRIPFLKIKVKHNT